MYRHVNSIYIITELSYSFHSNSRHPTPGGVWLSDAQMCYEDQIFKCYWKWMHFEIDWPKYFIIWSHCLPPYSEIDSATRRQGDIYLFEWHRYILLVLFLFSVQIFTFLHSVNDLAIQIMIYCKANISFNCMSTFSFLRYFCIFSTDSIFQVMWTITLSEG